MGMKIPFRISLITVEPVVFFYMTTSTLNIVCLPQLLLDNICLRTYSNATKCAAMGTGSFQAEYENIQQSSAMWFSASVGLVTSIVLFTIPTIGAVSDVIGRRTALIASPIALILQNAFLIAIVSSGSAFPTWLLLLPDIIPALFGGLSGVYVLANAYISLITSDDERSMRMTLVEAVLLLAMFASTMVSGFIIEQFGYIGAYVLNIILQVLSFLYAVLILKPVAKFNESRVGNRKGGTQRGISGGRETAVAGLAVGGISETGRGSVLHIDPQTNTAIFGVDVKSEGGKLVSTDSPCSKKIIDSENKNSTSSTKPEDKPLLNVIESEKDNLTPIDAIPSRNDFDSEIRQLTSSKASLETEAIPVKPKAIIDDISSSDNEKENLMPVQDKKVIANRNSPVCESSPHTGDVKMSINEIRKVLNPLKNVKAMISAVRKLKHRKVSLLLLLVLCLCTFAYTGEESIMIFFLKSKPFYMSARDVGFFLAYQSALLGILGLVVFNWLLQKVLKMRDTTLLVLATVAGVPCEILLGIATSAVMLYGIQILLAVLVLSIPTIRSFLTKMAEPESVGTVLGAISMVETLAALISNLVTPMAYAGLLSLYSGAAFFLLAAVLIVALGITLFCAHSFGKSTMQSNQAEDDI